MTPNNSQDLDFPSNIPYEEVYFSSSGNYCICYVDLVNSTKEVSYISDAMKVRKFYSIFLNSMAAIVRNFGAKIVKNVGDSLIFYFPESLDSINKDTWKDILDCLQALMDARPIINTKLYQEGLPAINYRISADYGKVEVAKSLSSKDDDLFVNADRSRLTQVLMNLFNNAIKFTDKGTIIVSVERADDNALIKVKDTGTGISDIVLSNLFTKFTTKSETGTGLGLFVSKNIVEAHGGNMLAENNMGEKGATFAFTIPTD